MVFKSMEMIYEPGVTPEKVWEPVFQATQKKVEAVLDADAKAKEARLAVARHMVLGKTITKCIRN